MFRVRTELPYLNNVNVVTSTYFRSVRTVEKGSEDAILSDTAVNNTLVSYFTSLEEARLETNNEALLYSASLDIMKKCLGFVTERKPSQVEGAGQGVVVTRGSISPKTVVSMYPG